MALPGFANPKGTRCRASTWAANCYVVKPIDFRALHIGANAMVTYCTVCVTDAELFAMFESP